MRGVPSRGAAERLQLPVGASYYQTPGGALMACPDLCRGRPHLSAEGTPWYYRGIWYYTGALLLLTPNFPPPLLLPRLLPSPETAVKLLFLSHQYKQRYFPPSSTSGFTPLTFFSTLLLPSSLLHTIHVLPPPHSCSPEASSSLQLSLFTT